MDKVLIQEELLGYFKNAGLCNVADTEEFELLLLYMDNFVWLVASLNFQAKNEIEKLVESAWEDYGKELKNRPTTQVGATQSESQEKDLKFMIDLRTNFKNFIMENLSNIVYQHDVFR